MRHKRFHDLPRDADKFSGMLRRLRLQSGMTQREISAQCGLYESCLSKLERGYRFPTPEEVEKLVRFYRLDGRDATELFTAAGFSVPVLTVETVEPPKANGASPNPSTVELMSRIDRIPLADRAKVIATVQNILDIYVLRKPESLSPKALLRADDV